MTQKSIKLNDVIIVIVRRNDRRIYFWGMSKCETVDRMKTGDLSEKDR